MQLGVARWRLIDGMRAPTRGAPTGYDVGATLVVAPVAHHFSAVATLGRVAKFTVIPAEAGIQGVSSLIGSGALSDSGFRLPTE